MRFARAKPDRFRIRSRDRDLATDAQRFDAVIEAMDTARRDLAREAEGLRARYTAAQTDAAFSLDMLENAEGSHGTETRLTILEDAVVYYEQRIRELSAQADALGELADAAKAKFAPFREKNGA